MDHAKVKSEMRRVYRHGPSGGTVDQARDVFIAELGQALRDARRGRIPLAKIHYRIISHSLTDLIAAEIDAAQVAS